MFPPHLLCLALLFFSLLPSAPGQTAKKTVENSARWEKEIVAFETADRANPPAKGGIVFVGSSSIRLWKTLTTDFPEYPVLNRGFGGSAVSDSVDFAERIVLPYEPRMVVLYAGGNDLASKKTPQQVFADFQAFVTKVRSRFPQTRIAYISIAGNPKRWEQVEEVKTTNTLIENFMKGQLGMKFINVFDKMLGPDGLPRPEIFSQDNLHMNAQGYQIWTDTIRPYLAE